MGNFAKNLNVGKRVLAGNILISMQRKQSFGEFFFGECQWREIANYVSFSKQRIIILGNLFAGIYDLSSFAMCLIGRLPTSYFLAIEYLRYSGQKE